VICVSLTWGCATASPIAPETSLSAATLTQALRDAGATVSVAETEPQDSFPFFSVQSRRTVVNGEDVHVFEYSSSEKAASDQAKVSKSGTPVGTTQITWIAPPRFYQKGRIIVLYVGNSDDVSRRLETVLGRPFAGVGS
jgi:hypothetical protein